MPFLNATHPLDSGAPFPSLSLTTVDDKAISVPASSDGYTVVLVYRGEW